MSKQVMIIAGNYVKANVDFNNLQGCDVYALDSDLENLEACIFVPVDFEGNPTRTSILGYTKIFEWRNTNSKIFPRLDGEVNLPRNGYMSFDDIKTSTEFNTLLFAKSKTVNELTDLLELSAEQTGKCFNKTVKFYDLEIVTEEDGVTPITGEDGITYIITG